eukprot:363880-Chlamydomonas_euryale.AAC.8
MWAAVHTMWAAIHTMWAAIRPATPSRALGMRKSVEANSIPQWKLPGKAAQQGQQQQLGVAADHEQSKLEQTVQEFPKIQAKSRRVQGHVAPIICTAGAGHCCCLWNAEELRQVSARVSRLCMEASACKGAGQARAPGARSCHTAMTGTGVTCANQLLQMHVSPPGMCNYFDSASTATTAPTTAWLQLAPLSAS